MKARLLFDQNLSPKLVRMLADVYPESRHTHHLGFDETSDLEIWKHAKSNGFIIVTKDSDFVDMSLLLGVPPKILWICRGNAAHR